MRGLGYQLTRYADDWVITCGSAREAKAALTAAKWVLTTLGVELKLTKTRIIHISQGFEFLGYKIKRGTRPLKLVSGKIRSGARSGSLYAYSREKSIQHFKDQIRRLTRRKAQVTTPELIGQLNPVIRRWGQYYCKAHIRKLFNQLDRWMLRRIWAHRYRHWRCKGWKELPNARLYGELGLVNLVSLIPSLKTRPKRTFVKAQCGKTARWV